MVWRWSAFVIAWWAAAAVAPAQEPVRGLDRLAGSWDLVRAWPEDALGRPKEKGRERLQLIFTGDRLAFARAGGERHEAKVRLDPDGRQLDITPVTGPDQGKTFYGVFTLEGDTLQIAWSENKQKRPADVKAKPGAGVTVLTLQRAKP